MDTSLLNLFDQFQNSEKEQVLAKFYEPYTTAQDEDQDNIHEKDRENLNNIQKYNHEAGHQNHNQFQQVNKNQHHIEKQQGEGGMHEDGDGHDHKNQKEDSMNIKENKQSTSGDENQLRKITLTLSKLLFQLS